MFYYEGKAFGIFAGAPAYTQNVCLSKVFILRKLHRLPLMACNCRVTNENVSAHTNLFVFLNNGTETDTTLRLYLKLVLVLVIFLLNENNAGIVVCCVCT